MRTTRVLLLLTCLLPVSIQAQQATGRQPVAEVLGRTVHQDELVPAQDAEREQARLSPGDYAAWLARTRSEALRARIWSAVFGDYAERRRIQPTDAEIDSNVEHQRRFEREDRIRRAKERERLQQTLASGQLSEAQRRQSQQHLETLEQLLRHDARLAEERRDPERAAAWAASERRVAAVWVRQWKLNQALHREFGGRIIFQQAGWEPIDAYRKLLDQYAARKAFVVRDAALREAVYAYFRHDFVYADEAKARFYFEKPYWERTPAEMKAAGF